MLVVMWDLHPGCPDKQGPLCKGISWGAHMSHIHWITRVDYFANVFRYLYLTSPTILSLISIGSNEKKWLFKMFLGHKHNGHMQSGTFYTFPRPVMEDQNHTKTIKCGQCIKVCGCPDHQLNMGMIVKDIIVKRHYFCRICYKVCDCKPNLCEHAENVPELGLYWPDTSW